MTRQDIVTALTGPRAEPRRATGQGHAPANIALVKYWGKRDTVLNLPVTGSLSVSLGDLGTTTELTLVDGPDTCLLNGLTVPTDTAFARRLTEYLDLFRPAPDRGFHVVTVNTIPTAAGLASSASGYAALVRALNALFDWNLPVSGQSILARLGSGSACRSLFDGFAEWRCGEQADGMDSHGVGIDAAWPGLAIGLIKVNTREKAIGSREAMRRTVDTSPLYAAWPDLVARDLAAVKAAIAAHDFDALGRIAEHNAMAMHATAIAAWPPALFWHPESIAVMHRIWKLRDGGAAVYFTMDAGPNLKVIAEQKNIRELADEFPDAEWVTPFGD